MFLHNYIPNPILFDLGFYQIRWYGLVLALAVAGGFFVILSLIRRRSFSLSRVLGIAGSYGGQAFSSFDKDKIFNLLFWIAIWGIIGGRVVHVLTFFDYYWHRPLEILAIWNGGIAFYGVFIGGLIASIFLLKKYGVKNKVENFQFPISNFQTNSNNQISNSKPRLPASNSRLPVSILSLLDALVVGLAFGQFIGRWGNWFNQELIGAPTGLPWGIPIDIWHRPVGLENFTHFHPVFLYESLFALVLFLGLWRMYKKMYVGSSLLTGTGMQNGSNQGIGANNTADFTRPRFAQPTSPCKGEGFDVPPPPNKGRVGERSSGLVFAVFLIFHSSARFFLEFLRFDPQPEFFRLRLFQFVAVAEFIAGWLVYFLVRLCYNKSNMNYKSDTNIQMYK